MSNRDTWVVWNIEGDVRHPETNEIVFPLNTGMGIREFTRLSHDLGIDNLRVRLEHNGPILSRKLTK